MKRYIYLLFFLSALSVVTMSNRKGRATVSNVGSTGAPGDDATVCQSCHNGPINVGIQINVLDNLDTVTSYIANKTYNIHVRVNHISGNVPVAHGFQMTLLNAVKGQNGPNLKDLVAFSNNVKLVIPRNGRLYAEQVDRSITNLFVTQWKAPAVGSGPVTIYAAGTGVNANDTDSGDGGSKSSLQIDEQITSSVDIANVSNIRVYPNPFLNSFWIEDLQNEIKKVVITDLFGRVIHQQQISQNQKQIDLSNFDNGVYFARMYDIQNAIIKTQKLMKRSVQP